ncbi:SCAN domain-containing protein 3-like [Sebastes fasciatus]|uniref:SCAN domain-containing protein 3-like n=1 Tax=Sebastes fasciatus TaxID=394691 RepID=UPI003D9E24C4
MKPSKLLRHLETKHPALKDKPLEYFERKKREQEGQKQLLRATTSTNASALRASYLVANRIAKAKKPFTIGEELILPATKDICRELLGEAAVKKIAQVPLSASTVTRRIEEIAEDIETQLLERINTSPWEMLASRKMPPELSSVLNDVVKVINHIKAHALNSRLFEQLCDEMDAEHRRLLLYTEIRWLSRGKSLARVFELREPLQRFLSEKKSPLAAHFSDEEWVAKLAYLCDIFNLLNELNLSLQGKMTTVFKLADKVAAFKAKLDLWGRRVNRGILDMFQTLAGILGETEPEPSFSQLVHDHLSLLLKEFERYFPTTKDPRTAKEWIRDPFVNKPGESSMSVQEEDQLLEIANDGGLKSVFETTTLPVFWIKVSAEYPEIATTALKTLLPFPTSYLCEAGFSAVTATKTKLRSRLDKSNTLRVSLSPITPRWDRLVAEKQAQGSH